MDTEAQMIFTQAARFDLSAGYLMQFLNQWIYDMKGRSLSNPSDEKNVMEGHKMPPMVIPATVNAAFSIELYLKALVKTEGKTFKKVHRYDDIFVMLDHSTQNIIRTKYDDIIKKRHCLSPHDHLS